MLLTLKILVVHCDSYHITAMAVKSAMSFMMLIGMNPNVSPDDLLMHSLAQSGFRFL